MKLIFDEYDDCWIWVADDNEDLELSPRFDEEDFAMYWKDRIAKELDKETKNLYNGEYVVLPSSKEHAEGMLRVASFYLNNLGYGPKGAN